MMIQFAALIVAAGESERLKELRRRTGAEDVSFVRRAVSVFQRAGVQEIAVVTGFRAERLEKELEGQGVTFLRNENYATTRMLVSAKIGFTYFRDRAQRIFFCPADVPFFLEETVRQEMKRTESVVYPVCGDRLGHPILLDAAVIPAILSYRGEDGLKGALDSLHGLTAGFVPVTDEATVLRPEQGGKLQKLIDLQNAQVVRAETEVTIAGVQPFLNAEMAGLLEAIRTLQSVREASDACGISYSKAWHLLRTAENETGYPLTERKAGGRNGGSAVLTERGEELLNLYRELSDRTAKYAEREFDRLASESSLFPGRVPKQKPDKESQKGRRRRRT